MTSIRIMATRLIDAQKATSQYSVQNQSIHATIVIICSDTPILNSPQLNDYGQKMNACFMQLLNLSCFCFLGADDLLGSFA